MARVNPEIRVTPQQSVFIQDHMASSVRMVAHNWAEVRNRTEAIVTINRLNGRLDSTDRLVLGQLRRRIEEA